MLRKNLFRILLLCFAALILSCTPLVSRKAAVFLLQCRRKLSAV